MSTKDLAKKTCNEKKTTFCLEHDVASWFAYWFNIFTKLNLPRHRRRSYPLVVPFNSPNNSFNIYKDF